MGFRNHLLHLSLVISVAVPILAQGQISPEQIATEEVIRRQETTIVLRETIARANRVEKEGDFKAAAELYEEAIKLIRQLGGVGVATEERAAFDGLNAARLELARQAFRRGEFKEADRQMDLLLKFDPQSATALSFKQYNNEVGASHKGRVPSPEVISRIPQYQNTKLDVATLVQDGKLLYEMRLLDEAEAKLKEAIRIDPSNKAAYYYMNLMQESRYGDEARRRDFMQKQRLVEVEKAWELPVKRELLPAPNPYVRTNVPNTSPRSRQIILAKLDTIQIPELFIDSLPLSEVVKFIHDETKRQDPEKRGLNFLINPFLEDAPSGRGGGPGGPGEFDPFGDEGGGAPPLLDPFGMPIAAPMAAVPGEMVDLDNVIVRINPPLMDISLHHALDAITKSADTPIKFMIEDYAVVFTQKAAEPPQLFTRTFKVDPNTFVQGLESVVGIPISEIGSSGGGGGGGGGRGGGGGGGRGGGGGQGGQGGGDDGLTIPRVSVSGGTTGGGQGGGGGGGVGGGGGGQGGQGGQGLSFVTRTNNMSSLSDMVRSFFVAAGVNLNTNAAGGASTQVFFNDRTGVLMVRASMQDLEIIQSAIEILNIAPQQVTIEAKFTEVTQQDTKGVGFDWFLGNFLLGGGKMIGSAGSQPSFTGIPDPGGANPAGTFPGIPGLGAPGTVGSQGTLIAPSASDGFGTSGLRNQIGIGSQQGAMPTVATMTGILTDPQFRLVIRALEQRDGVDVLSAPRVTTLSGRQAQMQVVDLITIVSGLNLQQTGAGGAQQQGGFGSSSSGVGSIAQFDTLSLPFGPVLDVLPYVSADGFSIQMTLIPTFTEFIGYDDPGPFVPQAQSVSQTAVGLPLTAVLPLPRLRSRQVVTSAIVWDGQTIVLGGLISEDVRNIKDKIPVLGDVPLLGRLFRSESKSTSKKNLIIFVTPTIVDPAGNRVHTDDELPFAKNAIPPQQPWSNRELNYRSGW